MLLLNYSVINFALSWISAATGPGLKNGEKIKSVHSKQNQYFIIFFSYVPFVLLLFWNRFEKNAAYNKYSVFFTQQNK